MVVGGGQAGLAASFYLRRAGVGHVVLDDQEEPGGAWRHTWPSLRLFSPAGYSSLPGWQMPSAQGYPDTAHVIDYLTRYEQRYDLPVHRPVRVESVRLADAGFTVDTDAGEIACRAVISATGTWSRPFVPHYPGIGVFAGDQVHSGRYAGPAQYRGRRVLVVGGANSGAQIAADLLDPAAGVDAVTWCTLGEPRYLPDDVDGRELFRLATAHVRGEDDGRGVGGLGDIVVVPPVRAARDDGRLVATPMFERFTDGGVAWADGSQAAIDDVVWCTGFRPALRHLAGLDLPRGNGRLRTDGPAVLDVPDLFVLGYGDWCGPASATLIGVGQWARGIVQTLAV